MSRLYEMKVSILKFNKKKEEDIIDAVSEEWAFSESYPQNCLSPEGKSSNILLLCGQDYLCGGESEEEFSDRLAKAIFKANGKSCKIEVTATYLEDIPSHTYAFGSKEFRSLVTNQVEET